MKEAIKIVMIMVTMIIIIIHHNTGTNRKLHVIQNRRRVLFQSKIM